MIGRGLAVLAVLRVAFAVFVPVTPEEAYHWNFGQHLDWGYYDHPPMIAWAIRLGCVFFGDTALGIRSVPLLFALGTTALVARLAERVHGKPAAGGAVVLLSVEPVLFLAGGGGYPDSPLLFFWALSMTLVWEALESGRGPLWIASGAALGAMGLSKYTGVFFGLAVLLHLATSARDRKWLATPWPYLACLVALVVMTPVFYWNATHDWASFRFQAVERLSESRPSRLYGFSYLAQQAGAVVPLTLPLAFVAIGQAWKSHRFYFWSFVPMVAFFFAVAWVRMVHLMWPLPAYLGLAVVMAGATGRVAEFYARRRAWLIGTFAAVFVGGVLHMTLFLPWISPIHDLYGWDAAAARAKEIRAEMAEGSFYLGLGRKYVCASQLAYRLRAPFEVHGKHLVGDEGLQYRFWADPASLAGRDAVVVIEGADRADGLRRATAGHFASLEPAGELEVRVGRRTLLEEPPVKFLFFKARGYKPPVPPRP